MEHETCKFKKIYFVANRRHYADLFGAKCSLAFFYIWLLPGSSLNVLKNFISLFQAIILFFFYKLGRDLRWKDYFTLWFILNEFTLMLFLSLFCVVCLLHVSRRRMFNFGPLSWELPNYYICTVSKFLLMESAVQKSFIWR